MTETYTAAADAALTADVYRAAIFVKIVFPSYTFRVSSLVRDYTLGGELYIGAGSLGSMSVVSENADMTADPVEFTLSGIDASVASSLRDFAHQGSVVTAQLALFDINDAIIPDPVTFFVGAVDVMSMVLADTLTITVRADSFLRLGFRGPDGHRRMQADQEKIFVGDLGLEFAPQLANTVPWGVPTAVEPVASTSSRYDGHHGLPARRGG